MTAAKKKQTTTTAPVCQKKWEIKYDCGALRYRKNEKNSTEQSCYLVVALTILLNVYCPDQISTADQITLNPGGQRANILEMAMIHYLKNKVGVVDFANAQGLVMF